VAAEDVETLRGVGLTDAAILHAAVQASFFNYLNRVADAVDIAYDYESRLPRMVKDAGRAPFLPPEAPVSRPGPLPMRLADRPQAYEAFHVWRAYLVERDAPLSARDRRVIVRSVAASLADGRTVGRCADAEARDERERALAAYAELLTVAPWKLGQENLDALRGLGLDDRALLDVVTVAAHQNAASRLELVLDEV
jgi:hypothetical protein